MWSVFGRKPVAAFFLFWGMAWTVFIFWPRDMNTPSDDQFRDFGLEQKLTKGIEALKKEVASLKAENSRLRR